MEGEKKQRHVLQWHMTHKCNLRCRHCYQTEYVEDTSEEFLNDIFDEYLRFLDKHNMFGHIYLTGGEPMVHPYFFGLCEKIKSHGMTLTVLTNGTLIDDEKARRMKEIGIDHVQVSLDGTEDIHDGIRGTGSFNKTLNGIDSLKKAGMKVMVSFTAQKSNYKSMPALAEICYAHKVDKLWWDRVVTETPEDTQALALTTPMFRKTVRTAGKLHDKYIRETGRMFVSCERPMQFVGCSEKCFNYGCHVGTNMIVILADGGVMPCRRLPFVIGNIKECSLSDIVFSSDLIKEIEQTPIPVECLDCRYLMRCGGGAKCVTYAQTGVLGARDVNCLKKKDFHFLRRMR